MTAPSLTTTFDSFFTSTMAKYEKGLAKNFIEYRPILRILMDNYGHKTSGSYMIQIPVEYGVNSNTKFFQPYDTIDTTPSEFALPAIYYWRQVASSATWSDVEAIANSGKEAIFDLAEGRLRQAIRSMSTLVGSECYSDGTSNGGNTIVGLAAGVSTAPATNPASGALGGIDAATQTFWRNNASTSCGSFAANGVKGTSYDYVITGYNNCTDGMMDKPNVAISDQNTWEYYNRTLLGTVQYHDPTQSKTGDLSFQGLAYNGITWYWDRQCPTGRLYFLNTNYVYFYVDPNMFFTWTEPRSWPNQLTKTRLVTLRLALVYKARMFHAVLDGWTA